MGIDKPKTMKCAEVRELLRPSDSFPMVLYDKDTASYYTLRPENFEAQKMPDGTVRVSVGVNWHDDPPEPEPQMRPLPMPNAAATTFKPIAGGNLEIDSFPRQNDFAAVGTKVEVCFNYQSDKSINGIVVRADAEHPYVRMFKLDDGRYVLDTECQWHPVK